MSAPKRRGRPPLDASDHSVAVNFSMPSKEYSEIQKQAQRERVSVQELIRRKVRRSDCGGKGE